MSTLLAKFKSYNATETVYKHDGKHPLNFRFLASINEN